MATTSPLLPAWLGEKPRPPRMPWMDVAGGAFMGFNPGGAFGVGAQTLPSMQRWGRMAPSEQQGQAGYWEDQLGVHSPDVMWLMNKLRPAGAISATPRWMVQ